MFAADEFYDLQIILVSALTPFISIWAAMFLTAVIMYAVLVLFMLVSRELMSRIQI
jgi:hypothetical protein